MSTAGSVQAYAKAFYEAAMERWLGVFDTVSARLEQNQKLLDQLSTADTGQRQRLLDSHIPPDVDAPVRNFLYALLERGDLGQLPEIAAHLRQMMAALGEGPLPVEVATAVNLTAEEQQDMAAKLQQRFGNNISVRYRVDPAILGGVVVRAGDKLIDGSVATRLAEMKQALGVAARE